LIPKASHTVRREVRDAEAASTLMNEAHADDGHDGELGGVSRKVEALRVRGIRLSHRSEVMSPHR
jgi:hypothetical protein